MNKNIKILIFGGSGMVGDSLIRKFSHVGYKNILSPNSKEVNLLDTNLVDNYIKKNNPDYIIHAAAKVAGIQANKEFNHAFLYENIQMQNHVIMSAHNNSINNLMFFGSSCVYHKNINKPIKESDLLGGPLEETNEGYALAKITGIKLCNFLRKKFKRNYFSVMPTNMYGVKDNFNPLLSHVIPALFRKFHEAKINNLNEVHVYGSGIAKREFMHVDDLADACVLLMETSHDYDLINIGTGSDIKISELIDIIKNIVGYSGQIVYDKKNPDGTLRKVLNTKLINELGWVPKRNFQIELTKIYSYIVENKII